MVGKLIFFTGTTVPSGYLQCDGAAISRTTYADLFAAIGTAFGRGNGSTTFNVPDLRGKFVRSKDSALGRDVYAATRTALLTGGATKDNVGSFQNSINYHTHSFQFTQYSCAQTGFAQSVSGATTTLDVDESAHPHNIHAMPLIRFQ